MTVRDWLKLVLAVAVPCAAHGVSAQTPTVLTVQVINGTTNGSPVEGDEVVVELYRREGLADSLTARAGADGTAVFDSVPTELPAQAVARVKHQDMMFRGGPVVLPADGGNVTMSVRVYDVSDDMRLLSVGTHHVNISVQNGSLAVAEYMQLRNASDMAVRGVRRDDQGKPVVLKIDLPDGFKDFRATGYLVPTALVVTDAGFYDTLATPPGEHHVRFSYNLDVKRGTTEITREIGLPTSELAVFWEGPPGKIEGLGEPDGQLVDSQGRPVEYYLRPDLKAGDVVTLQVSGLRAGQSQDRTWLILAVVFAAVMIVAVLKARKPEPAARDV